MNALLLDRKDDREEPLALPDASAKPTASDYRALLVKHRRTQLVNIRENLQRLAQSYDRAADTILARVRALPDTVDRNGTGWLKAQLEAIRAIREEADRLRRDYGDLLDLSMLSSAQDAANREAEVARLVGADPQQNLLPTLSKQVTLTTGVDVGVQYGTLAKDAVEGVANRYYRDGLKLSDRLYNLSTSTLKTVEDAIVSGIAAGTSSRKLADELQELLSADGVQTPRYNAMRIARTEIRVAHQEAHIRSTIDPMTGTLKPYLAGVRWSLSLSHPAPDVCDIYATHDEGKGSGIYEPGAVPVSHPHCLCNTTSVLVEFPEVGINGKTPNVAAVPESQIRYYAERLGDKPAAALLARS